MKASRLLVAAAILVALALASGCSVPLAETPTSAVSATSTPFAGAGETPGLTATSPAFGTPYPGETMTP